MGKFLAAEKLRQAHFKINAPYFSAPARAEGVYKKHAYPFCLPAACAEENLFSEIRPPTLAYFARHGINWHDGRGGMPSNHLCDSQVSCANFLFPFADKPAALSALLRPVFPAIGAMLPVEDGQYVAFEWIGQQDYLREQAGRQGKRSRGAHFTSADAAVMSEQTDGQKLFMLIEWKYTESYPPTWKRYASSGTDRTKTYERLYLADDCPLAKEHIPTFDSLFYEPFYQLMRQQFLAHEMEKAHELGADKVVLLHLSPGHNRDFKRITSPALQNAGDSATQVWRKLLKHPDRFVAAYTEDVFGPFQAAEFPALAKWRRYISLRYNWVDAGSVE